MNPTTTLDTLDAEPLNPPPVLDGVDADRTDVAAVDADADKGIEAAEATFGEAPGTEGDYSDYSSSSLLITLLLYCSRAITLLLY